NFLDTTSLGELRTRLQILDNDLMRIQAVLPPGAGYLPGASGVYHTVRMAHDLVQSGTYGIDAALMLLPHLKGILSGLSDSSGSTQTPQSAQPPALTLADIDQVQGAVQAASTWAQQALDERNMVSDDDLARFGFGSLVPTLHKLDKVAPQMPQYL